MKYLTLDTTTKVTALSLAEDGKAVAEGFLHTSKTHSERLIPMLDQLLHAAAWELEDLDLIGVVRGPGSFTGIRIGIATARGLAQVLKIPQLGVLSLDALAWAGYGRVEEIVPILDARKNEWYSARYRWQDGLDGQDERKGPLCLTEACAVNPEAWLNRLKEMGGTYLFVGDAAGKAQELIRETLGSKAMVLPDYQSLPRGAYAARAVWQKWQEQRDGEKPEPYYIRLSEAEVNWRKKEEARRLSQ